MAISTFFGILFHVHCVADWTSLAGVGSRHVIVASNALQKATEIVAGGCVSPFTADE
jgi:hypothetical protein